jgi:hypothetical protein
LSPPANSSSDQQGSSLKLTITQEGKSRRGRAGGEELEEKSWRCYPRVPLIRKDCAI